MEKRIGTALILVENKDLILKLNQIISEHADIIIGRQGLPVKDKNISIISLVLGGTTDKIGFLTGKIGRLKNIQIKSVLLKSSTNHEKN